MAEKYSQLTEPLIDKGPSDEQPIVFEEQPNQMNNDHYIVELPDFESKEYEEKNIYDAVPALIYNEERQRLIILVGSKLSGSIKYLYQFLLPDCAQLSELHLSDYKAYQFDRLTLLNSDYFSFTISDGENNSKLSIAKIDDFFYDQACYIIIHPSSTNILKIDFPNNIFYYDQATEQFTKRKIELDHFKNQEYNNQKVLNLEDLPIIGSITSNKYLGSNGEHYRHLWTLSINYELIVDDNSKLIMMIDFKTDNIKKFSFNQDEMILDILDQDRILFIGDKTIRFFKFKYFFVDQQLKQELDAEKGYFELTKMSEVQLQGEIEKTPCSSFTSGQPYLNGNHFYYFSNGQLTMYDLANQVQVWQQDIPSHQQNRIISIHNQDYILYLNQQSQLHLSCIKKQQQIITPVYVDYFDEKTTASKSTIFVDDGSYSYYQNEMIQFIETKKGKHHQLNIQFGMRIKSLRYIEELELVLIFSDCSISLMKLQEKSYDLQEVINVKCDEQSYYLKGCELFMIDTSNQAFLQIKIRSHTDFEIITLNSDIDAFCLKYINEESIFYAYLKQDSVIYLMNQNGQVLKKLDLDIDQNDIIDIQEDDVTFIDRPSQQLQLINEYEHKIIRFDDKEQKYQWQRFNKYIIGIEQHINAILILNREDISLIAQFNLNYQAYLDSEKAIHQFKISKSQGKSQKLYIYASKYFKEVFELNLELLKPLEDQVSTSKFYEYDNQKQEYTYYSNCEDKIQICFFNSKLFLGNDYEQQVTSYSKDDIQVIKYLRENDLQKLLINPIPYAQTFLHHISLRPRVLEEFIKKLLFVDQETLPLLLALNKDKESPIDLAIKNNQTKSIALFFDMMIRFQEHFVFNYLFDKQICTLLDKGFNLQEYFLSKFPVIQIQETFYPSLHQNALHKIYICNKDNPYDILTEQTYNEIIGQDLISSDKTISADQNQKENVTAIDYFLINLPVTIQDRQLSQLLNNTDQIEIFDTICIQTIINFKWNTYTFNFFFIQFIVFVSFIVVFLIDLYYSIWTQDNQEFDYIPIIFKAIGISILTYFLIYEIRSAMKQTCSVYIQDMWNSFDFLLISVYIAYAIVDTMHLSLSFKNTLISSILLLAFVKLNFFLRIFDGFSFLVSMMQGVFLDLKYFMAFFLLTVLEFGFLFTVLVENSETYDSIGSMGYFIMAFRTSLGDFDLDNYGTKIEITDDQQTLLIIILRWIIWIIGVFVMNIVFMNFIIAVISQSYEKVMQKLIAQSYKVKIDMIAERELHFNEQDFKNENLFPKFLILRKPCEDEERTGQEWQGFVKDIKLHLAKNVQKSKNEIQSDIAVLQKQINTKFTDISDGQKQIEERFSKIEQNLRAFDDVQKHQAIMNERVQSIQDQLNQLIQHLIPKHE